MLKIFIVGLLCIFFDLLLCIGLFWIKFGVGFFLLRERRGDWFFILFLIGEVDCGVVVRWRGGVLKVF